MHKKGLKFAPLVELAKLNFTKMAKAGPGFDDLPEHPSVQINYFSPRLGLQGSQAFGT